MQSQMKRSLSLACAVIVVFALFSPSQFRVAGDVGNGYIQHNLVSDIPGMAITTDPSLKNPWGIAFSPTGPFWISDAGTGLSTVYNGSAAKLGLTVTIPPAPGSTDPGSPTGIVWNGTSDFMVSQGGQSAPAVFIFATEDGTISGWNPGVSPTSAVLAPNAAVEGAVYKGLALASGAFGNRLFATDFKNNLVRMFDGGFNPAGSFTDPTLPPGFAPFGIANIGGMLYVTFALQEGPDNEDDEAGPGNGLVDVFSPEGVLIRRFASQGTLNSPWGLAFAASFGDFNNALLVGNFGDGTINAFDFTTGDFLGQLTDTRGLPIFIDGLWALIFGNGGQGGSPRVLYFTAGLNDEENGLFGDLQPSQSNGGIINP